MGSFSSWWDSNPLGLDCTQVVSYADGKDALSFEREGVIAHADLAALLTPIEPVRTTVGSLRDRISLQAYYKLPIAMMVDAIGGGGCTDVGVYPCGQCCRQF